MIDFYKNFKNGGFGGFSVVDFILELLTDGFLLVPLKIAARCRT
nr:MAG TPA: hypothetical protein [Caudoviricetes sp.]